MMGGVPSSTCMCPALPPTLPASQVLLSRFHSRDFSFHVFGYMGYNGTGYSITERALDLPLVSRYTAMQSTAWVKVYTSSDCRQIEDIS